MIDGARVLALIPARGGSKGLPRKNLAEIGGRSLVARAVEAALMAFTVDRVVVSSDDVEILEAALAAGCDEALRRPAALAADETPAIDVVRHVVVEAGAGFDYIVLLQPTSPLRLPEDIDAAVRRCHESDAVACVSVTLADKPPEWLFRLREDGRLVAAMPEFDRYHRRQDIPAAYALNGAVYVARPERLAAGEAFLEPGTVAYEMPRERSLDIDTELDLYVARAICSRRKDEEV